MPIIRYLEDGTLLDEKSEAKKLKFQATRYTLHDGILFKRGHSTPLLRCLDDQEATHVLREIYEGGMREPHRGAGIGGQIT